MTTPIPRESMAVTERLAYLNHAGVAPLSRPGFAAMLASAEEAAHLGSLSVDAADERREEIRAASAALMGVPVDGVAFVKNTTEALGFVANGLEWSPGDRVLVPAHEFPSTIYPWLALADRGVVVEPLAPANEAGEVPIEVYEAAFAEGPVRLVATSWVQFGRGWRTDLAALGSLCREHSALLCADVIQGLGVIPADLGAWGVDFAMADAHKWLLGPEGAGLLYVAPDRIDSLRVLEPGWNSVVHRKDWENREWVPDPTARRFEGGTMTSAAFAAMGASIDLLVGAGIERVWSHVDAWCGNLASAVAERGLPVWSARTGAGRSGIVTFGTADADPATVASQLVTVGVVCSPRGGGIRVAPHGYNDEADLEHFLRALDTALRS
ncbi:MAG: aminotransferase class V-fold PLP-dependent enzyme [Acidimicrobiia bacterium]|nr:aminotransferase class V-fold PLP-dependent enzyme [Acidimicrobiia bacterium]